DHGVEFAQPLHPDFRVVRENWRHDSRAGAAARQPEHDGGALHHPGARPLARRRPRLLRRPRLQRLHAGRALREG
ncbi:Protein of unknown function, partial [Gryllus bimaculatus]